MTNISAPKPRVLDPLYADEYEEGYTAASERRSAIECPYTFQRAGYPPQHEFERNTRPKLDAWFAGWKAWLDERGLGFNFKPHRTRPRPPSSTDG